MFSHHRRTFIKGSHRPTRWALRETKMLLNAQILFKVDSDHCKHFFIHYSIGSSIFDSIEYLIMSRDSVQKSTVEYVLIWKNFQFFEQFALKMSHS